MKSVMTGIILFLSTCALAATPVGIRVAYVDLQKAIQTVDAGKKAKTQLEKEGASKRAALEKEQEGLQKEAESFEKKAAILNEGARMKQQGEIQKKLVDFQKKMAETQNEVIKRERELTQPLLVELRAIIEGIGKERSYQIILEKNEGAVLYAEAGSDLTDEVIDKFNSRHKKK
jgi:outer membrane protein